MAENVDEFEPKISVHRSTSREEKTKTKTENIITLNLHEFPIIESFRICLSQFENIQQIQHVCSGSI